MEKFFKPVHSPLTQDEIKPRRDRHQHQHHHRNHQQDPRHQHYNHRHRYHQDQDKSHNYTKLDDNDRDKDESYGHHCHHHRSQYPHLDKEDELHDIQRTTFSLFKASSSSLSSFSSSSSSSNSSWYTEKSANDPFSAHPTERPQHSLSCSNILEVRGGFREDDGSEPIMLATIKCGNSGGTSDQACGRSQQREKPSFSSLHRGHSRSDEGPLQVNDDNNFKGRQHRAPHIDHGPLYKTASLSRSLAFSEEDIVLGVSAGPKRAVSSSQLPGKGILKNMEPRPDIRKAKSMEVLSPRVSKEHQQGGAKGKEVVQTEMERSRENFIKGKLQFSAFLDEITKQVISPSHLSSLGVNNPKTTEQTSAHGRAQPQLPPKKHRESSGDERQQWPKHETVSHGKTQSHHKKHSNHPNSDKLIPYAARNHCSSPPPHHQPHPTSHQAHASSSCKDRRPSLTEGPMTSEQYGRYGPPHLTDGTSTSPETIVSKYRHHSKQSRVGCHGALPTPQHLPRHQPHHSPDYQGAVDFAPTPAQTSGSRSELESPSSKSDSSRTRDTASTATSCSLERSRRYHSQTTHTGQPKQLRETPCKADHIRVLQEEKADLQQNLLQMVLCIQSLEGELQRTREECNHIKEKYKSLLETHTGTRQANNILGEHLHIASESLSSERKYLMSRIGQLNSEVEEAHRTIATLENINLPCLIKELLEKHFDSTEAIQNFLQSAGSNCQSATPAVVDNQSSMGKATEAPPDWMKDAEPCQQRVTAFMPWKQDETTTGGEDHPSDQHGSRPTSAFSVADISEAIYEKMAANSFGNPKLSHPQQQYPPLGTTHPDSALNRQQTYLFGDGEGGGGGAAELEEWARDVTFVSAQRILDDFTHQLQSHKQSARRKEWADAQKWGGEETG